VAGSSNLIQPRPQSDVKRRYWLSEASPVGGGDGGDPKPTQNRSPSSPPPQALCPPRHCPAGCLLLQPLGWHLRVVLLFAGANRSSTVPLLCRGHSKEVTGISPSRAPCGNGGKASPAPSYVATTRPCVPGARRTDVASARCFPGERKEMSPRFKLNPINRKALAGLNVSLPSASKFPEPSFSPQSAREAKTSTCLFKPSRFHPGMA